MLPVTQPNAPYYPLSTLNQFDVFTDRADALQKTGMEPATWDPSRRRKRWFDADAAKLPPDTKVTYKYWQPVLGGKATALTIEMTAVEAANLNMPGVHSYPKYKPAQSGAFETIQDALGNVLTTMSIGSEFDLTTFPDAQGLAAELTAAGFTFAAIQQHQNIEAFAIKYVATETRRWWEISINGQWLTVGQLLKQKYAQGVDAPGHWTKGTDGMPLWVSDLPQDAGQSDPRPEIPCPQRDLLATETFGPNPGLMGGQTMVFRSDNAAGIAVAQANSEASNVAAILKGVRAICAVLRLPDPTL